MCGGDSRSGCVRGVVAVTTVLVVVMIVTVVAVVMVIVIVRVVVVIAIGGERLIVSVCCGGYGRFGCGGGIDKDGPDNGRSSGFGDQGDWPWWS